MRNPFQTYRSKPSFKKGDRVTLRGDASKVGVVVGIRQPGAVRILPSYSIEWEGFRSPSYYAPYKESELIRLKGESNEDCESAA